MWSSQIVLDLTWQVVAGEESKEIRDQYHREMRVLEAIYPRISSIPPKSESSLALFDNFCFHDFSHIRMFFFSWMQSFSYSGC